MPPYQWKFHARAVEDTRALALDGKCLREKCEQNHDLGYELLKRFCQIVERRLEATRLQLLDVYGSRRVIMAAAVANDPMLPQPHRVRQVVKETPDTFTLTLEPPDGAGETAFRPGQFSMLWVFGVGELPISISGDPAERDRLVYTVRSVGKATHAFVGSEVGRQRRRARSVWDRLAGGGRARTRRHHGGGWNRVGSVAPGDL